MTIEQLTLRYVPFPTERSSTSDSVKDSYVIAHVGYDFNKLMKKGHFRISGAQGALPVWTDFVKSIIKKTLCRLS